MAVHARKEMIYRPEPTIHVSPTIQPKTSVHPKRWISKGEKYLLLAFVALFTMTSVFALHTQATIHSTSNEIQNIEQKIDETKKQNTDLSMQVSELSTYERIWEKAKSLGLTLNEQNVKVVTGQ